jgi:hypothetical protein
MGQLLAKHVLNAAVNPMVYITTGGIETIYEGESVTFEAHLTGGGTPGYTYEWSVKEEGDTSWSPVGGDSSTWTWNPASGDAGMYAIQCIVTDAQARSGECIWKGFAVSSSNGGETAIPTLSEWGMIIFMTIILGIGVVTLLRRRMV